MKSRYHLIGFLLLAAVVVLAACGRAAPPTSDTTLPGADVPYSQNTSEGNVVPTYTPIEQSPPEATELQSLSTDASDTQATVSPGAPECQTPIASVKANNAYLRDGPDLRFEEKAQYENGDQFTVLGRFKDWYQVESSDGNNGWFYKDWLAIPPGIDTNKICSLPEQGLPSPELRLTPTSEKTREQNQEGICTPTYYDSCD